MKTFRLRNKIPVILAPMDSTSVMTALILFKVGSRYEQRQNNGVAHFVEHLFFKGTEHRPSTLAIATALDGVGAEYNAFTSKDYTGYYVKVASRHTPLALDILADILFHPLFNAEEIDRERQVIVEEINMYEDNPMATAEEVVEEMIFGVTHPLGYHIAGPRENIRKISRRNIIRFRDQFYQPENMIIILAGYIPQAARRLLRYHFSAVPSAHHRFPKPRPFRFTQTRARVRCVRKNTAQTHLALAFPGPAVSSPQLPCAEVMATILGGNMSSRLFINVRERQGLCYYIRAQSTPYEDTGCVTIQAGFDTQRLDNALRAIMQELALLRTQCVSAEELTRAKEFFSGKMCIQMEDSEAVASWWGRQALFRKTSQSTNEYLRKIQRVTAEEIRAFARYALHPRHGNLAVIGPSGASMIQHLRRVLATF